MTQITWASFQTVDGSFVCAEGGGGHEVVANRPALGAWEAFRLTWLSQDTVALRAFNGQYVCAEGGGGHEVVANRDEIGPWETFGWVIVGLSGGADTVEKVALRASNGQYVCPEGGGGHEVVANRDEVGDWERFQLVSPPRQIVAPPGWGSSIH